MQPSYSLSNLSPIDQFFKYKSEISTSLAPSSLLDEFSVIGSQILQLNQNSTFKASKFAQPASFATLRSDRQVLAATHQNSISISAIRTKSVLKQFKTPNPPICVSFVGTSKIASISKAGHVVVWDIAVGDIVFAVQLKFELDYCIQCGEKLLVLGSNNIVLLNIDSREIQFGGMKRKSVVEWNINVGQYKSRAISALMINQCEVLICTDSGMQIIDIKKGYTKAMCHILKGVSQSILVDNDIFFACMDGSIRSTSFSLESNKILYRLKQPILYFSRYFVKQQEFFAVSTSKPIIYILSTQPLQEQKQILKKFSMPSQQNSTVLALPKPVVLPESIEVLMKNRAFSKALNLALSNPDQFIRQNLVIQILYDVVSSSEKAIAETVLYLTDDNKINLYRLLIDNFGRKDFGLICSAIVYQFEKIGIEQGIVGNWQQDIIKISYEWIAMEKDLIFITDKL